MAAIITTKFRYKNADSLIDDLAGNGPNTYYLGIGRTETWVTGGGSESAPPLPLDTGLSEVDALSNAIAFKKIAGAGISRAIPRYNWISGQTYAEYDDRDSTLSTKQYYVITDELNVYKCIKAGPSGSINKPTGSDLTIVSYNDGYAWKFMYTITNINVVKFLTSTFMPVVTLLTDDTTSQWDVQQSAIKGGIHRIKVVAGGSGYSTTKPTVTITGNGTGATVIASGITVAQDGSISEILINTPGVGYDIATVTISGGSGNGATARAVISPKGGHGANPADELGAYYVMIDTELVGADGAGDFIVDNDFRQIMLVANPREINNARDELKGQWVTATNYVVGDVVRYQDTSYVCDTNHTSDVFADDISYWTASAVSSSVTLSALTTIQYTLTSGTVVKDTVLTGQTSGAIAWVDSVNTTDSEIKFHQNASTGFKTFAVGETVTIGSASAVVDAVLSPEYEPLTGNVVYIENLSLVTRNTSQTEDVKLVLEL